MGGSGVNDPSADVGVVYAQIVLPISRYRAFTYKVPPDLTGELQPGSFVRVPFRQRSAIGVVAELTATTSFKGPLKSIAALLTEPTPLPAELWSTLQWVSDYYLTPLGLVLKTALSLAFTGPGPQRTRLTVALTAEGRRALDSWTRSAPAQKALLTQLASHTAPVVMADLLSEIPSARSAAKRLADLGYVAISEVARTTDPLAPVAADAQAGVTLTGEQSAAMVSLRKSLSSDKFAPFLLRGVTSSGKTEVYFQAARETLAAGKSVLVLVPEIALTPQVATRFRRVFGAEVALWHSRLTRAEKAWTWRELQQGRFKVVVGARSAVFVPLRRLGLIIVDEEQEGSYKQEDQAPRYHARDVALVRGREAGATVILATATPSLESYYNGLSNRYETLNLTQRYGGAAYPRVRMIDMRLERQKSDNYGLIFSPPLIEAIGLRLERGEQVVLLQNRRGFAPVCACNDCDFVAE